MYRQYFPPTQKNSPISTKTFFQNRLRLAQMRANGRKGKLFRATQNIIRSRPTGRKCRYGNRISGNFWPSARNFCGRGQGEFPGEAVEKPNFSTLSTSLSTAGKSPKTVSITTFDRFRRKPDFSGFVIFSCPSTAAASWKIRPRLRLPRERGGNRRAFSIRAALAADRIPKNFIDWKILLQFLTICAILF